MRYFAALLSIILFAGPAYGASVFSSGFEGCSNGGTCATSGWDSEVDTGSDMAASTSVARSGSCSCRFIVDDTTVEYVYEDDAFNTLTEAWFRGYFLIESDTNYLTNNFGGLFRMKSEDGSEDTWFLRYTQNSSGHAWGMNAEYGIDAGGTSGTSRRDTIYANVWNCVEVHWKQSSGSNDGTFSWWMNDRQAVNVTGIDNDTIDAGDFWAGAYFGLDAGSPDLVVYLDDIEIDDADRIGCDGIPSRPSPSVGQFQSTY